MYRLLFALVLVVVQVPGAVNAQARSAVGVHLTVIEAAATVQSPACAGCAAAVVTHAGPTPTVQLQWEDGAGSLLRSQAATRAVPVRIPAGVGEPAPDHGRAVHLPGLFAQGSEPATGTLTMTVIVH